MQRGEMYVQYGDLPIKTAIEVLSNFKDVISWKSGCKVLDIGCGPGNITHDIFFPLLPKSTEKVVGVDRCPDYINYAKNHYGKNPVISFQLLDIVNDEVPKEFEEYFDYAVSFLCFHQFSNHEAAFRNINKMLKPGGEILFYFPVTANTFQLYKVLDEQAKWECLRDYKMHCSPYKDSTDPKDELKILLNKMGYKIRSLNIDEKRYKFPLQYLQKLQQTLIPLPVPDDLSEEILKAAVMASRSLNFIGMNENGTEYYDFIYNLAILYATLIQQKFAVANSQYSPDLAHFGLKSIPVLQKILPNELAIKLFSRYSKEEIENLNLVNKPFGLYLFIEWSYL